MFVINAATRPRPALALPSSPRWPCCLEETTAHPGDGPGPWCLRRPHPCGHAILRKPWPTLATRPRSSFHAVLALAAVSRTPRAIPACCSISDVHIVLALVAEPSRRHRSSSRYFQPRPCTDYIISILHML